MTTAGKMNFLYSAFPGCLFVEKFLIENLPLGASLGYFFGIGVQLVTDLSIDISIHLQLPYNNPPHLAPDVTLFCRRGYDIPVQKLLQKDMGEVSYFVVRETHKIILRSFTSFCFVRSNSLR